VKIDRIIFMHPVGIFAGSKLMISLVMISIFAQGALTLSGSIYGL